MDYMPGAVCLAASHTDKLKSIGRNALKKAHLTSNSQKLSVINFKEIADKYDESMKKRAGDGEGTEILHVIVYKFMQKHQRIYCTSV